MKKQMVGSVSGNVLGMIADLALNLQHERGISLEEFARFLKRENPFQESDFEPDFKPDFITDWQNFYWQYFGIKVDFSKLTIPKKKKGFDRLLIIPKGMMPSIAFNVGKEKYPSWKYIDGSLNDAIDWTEEARDPRKRAYAIWIRNRREADKELKNMSAYKLKEKNINGITLTERLIYELKCYTETGVHLDINNITLCSGSRFFDGGVPRTYCDGVKFCIGWCNSDYILGSMCSREIVS